MWKTFSLILYKSATGKVVKVGTFICIPTTRPPPHQFLTPANWRRWVRMNDLHCPRSFVSSIAPLNVSPTDSMFSFILSIIQRILGLSLFLFPSNLACSASRGIRSIVILSHVQNIGGFVLICLVVCLSELHCLYLPGQSIILPVRFVSVSKCPFDLVYASSKEKNLHTCVKILIIIKDLMVLDKKASYG